MRSSVAVVLLVAVVMVDGPAAQAQAPTTCLAEVDGASFDDTVDFAGRVRSFAGEDGSVVSRTLRCPYRAPDGRATELVLEWDEVPLGRFDCADETLVIDDGDPPSGQIDHPELQAAVLLDGPDVASIGSMEPAARIILGAVPSSAASCAAGDAAAGPEPEGGVAVMPVVLGGLIVLAAAAWLLARRRRAAALDRPAESAAPVPPDPAAPFVVGAREGPLDAMAAAAVLALDRGRPDLARIAIRARRPVPPDEPDAQRQLAGRILEAAGRPTDGSGTDR